MRKVFSLLGIFFLFCYGESECTLDVPTLVVTNPYGCFEDVNIQGPTKVWGELFEMARKTIDISAFYMLHYEHSSAGKAVEELYDKLESAAERGVKVRIILDYPVYRDGDESYRFTPSRLAQVKNIELRSVYISFESDDDAQSDDGIMHAKYFVVDSTFLYVGSHNWSYASMFENREIGILLKSEALSRMVLSAFERDWQSGFSIGESPKSIVVDGEFYFVSGFDGVKDVSDTSLNSYFSWIYPVETAPLGLNDTNIADIEPVLIWLVENACSLVEIEVNTFNSKRLADALVSAAKRGVKIKIIIDGYYYSRAKAFFRKLNATENIEVKPADIRNAGRNPERGSIHSKLMIVDRKRVYIGSSTFSSVQFHRCRNLGLAFESEMLSQRCHEFFMLGWNSSCVFKVK